MERIFVTWSLFFILAGISPAQTPDKPATPVATPTVEQIVAKFEKAIGGKAAWEKVTSRVSKGTIEVPSAGLTGSVERYEEAPNKAVTLASLAGGEYRQGFDGKSGWSSDPQFGLRDLSGDELADARLEAEFNQAVRLREIFPQMKVIGADKANATDVYVVEATPKQGPPQKFYFEQASGLLVHVELARHSPMGDAPVQIDLSDYTDVDGLKLPLKIVEQTPEGEFQVRLSEVHQNVAIDDSKFAKPASP